MVSNGHEQVIFYFVFYVAIKVLVADKSTLYILNPHMIVMKWKPLQISIYILLLLALHIGLFICIICLNLNTKK